MVNTEIRSIIFFVAKDREALHSHKKQDQELTVAQIMNSLLQNSDKLKKVGKSSRPFRYALHQIPYDYTAEVTNRFKGLDLMSTVPEELWMEVHNTAQEAVIQTMPKRNKFKKTKWWSVEALQTAVKRREVKSKGEKGRYTHLNGKFQRTARRGKTACLSEQCKEIEERDRMGNIRDYLQEN